MWTWLRQIADSFMGRTGKPSRLDTATRMAMDADFSRCRETEPQTPQASPPELSQIEELARLVGEHEPRRVVSFSPPKRRRR